MPPVDSTSIASIEPLAVKPRVAWRMISCGHSRGYELLRAGELESFLDGASRKIIVESIKAYVARRRAANDGKFRARGRRQA